MARAVLHLGRLDVRDTNLRPVEAERRWRQRTHRA
jgi:hypothetical protein